ncbi:MAG: hypothetical protein J7498_05510 [Sphingobium sp.]|nr:hypothetical protein [Sphingobium sp.]
MYARRIPRPKPLKELLKRFPAPTGGWVSNRNLADPSQPGVAQGAAILDNFFPKASSVIMRRGRVAYDRVPSDPLAMFSYKNGNNKKLFTATETNIYNITIPPAASVVAGKTSGDWSVVQFATTGGVFLIGVNGADSGFQYDGTTFSVPAMTFPGGLTTADMSYVWAYKNRLWFAQKNSMNAYYLAVDSIGGAATVFPLAGIFGKGGSLMFGQAWSLDSGAQGGLSEQNIFVSTEGEVAVYQGADPSSASDWQKVGVYRIGTPLGKNAFFRGGGDLAIATSVGLVPLSKAISLDITSLNVATVSYNIADAWSEAVFLRGLEGWSCELWPEQKMAFVSPPDIVGSSSPVAFISNTETGAWCRFTNWRMLCMEVFDGQLYFGSPGGTIYAANQSGLDGDMPYTGVVMPLFEDVGSPASSKVGRMGRTVIRSLGVVSSAIAMHVDFNMTMGVAPDSSGGASSNLWGTGTWGASTWGAAAPEFINQDWKSIGGLGYAITLSCQITSGSEAPLDAEIIRQEMTYTQGGLVS